MRVGGALPFSEISGYEPVQKDGVKGAINKINTHNGCIIADSVGLGKTFEALAIIKYYELRNHKAYIPLFSVLISSQLFC